MRSIRWNRLAKLDYYENIDYLLNKWTEKEAQKFIDEVYEIEFILKNKIVDFQKTDFKDVHRCVINKHISLFYRILDDNSIEFLRFWNNLKNDKDLKL